MGIQSSNGLTNIQENNIYDFLNFVENNPRRIICKADGSKALYEYCCYYRRLCFDEIRYGTKTVLITLGRTNVKNNHWATHFYRPVGVQKEIYRKAINQLLKNWRKYGFNKY